MDSVLKSLLSFIVFQPLSLSDSSVVLKLMSMEFQAQLKTNTHT